MQFWIEFAHVNQIYFSIFSNYFIFKKALDRAQVTENPLIYLTLAQLHKYNYN